MGKSAASVDPEGILGVDAWLTPKHGPRTDARTLTPTASRAGRLVWQSPAGNIVAVSEHTEGALQVTVPGVATFTAHATPPIVIEPCGDADAFSIELSFERFALPMLLQARGLELLHASAVRCPSGVVLFCGTSGTGKSTLASALAARGYEPWSDDMAALEVNQHAVTAVRLPFRWRLRTNSEVPRTRTADGSVRAPVHALVVLDRTTSGFRSEQLDPAAAFRRVFPHAMCFDLFDEQRTKLTLNRYFDLCARASVHHVEFVPDLHQLDRLLDGLEALLAG